MHLLTGGLENISFKSSKCPEFSDLSIFPSHDKLRIAIPENNIEEYESALGSLIENKKQLSFYKPHEMRDFNDFIFCSNIDLENKAQNSTYEIDWQILAKSPRLNTNMVIYVPSDNCVSLMCPCWCGGGGIEFKLNDGDISPEHITCPDAVKVEKMGEIYKLTAYEGWIWTIEDITENTVIECYFISGIGQIDDDINAQSEYYNMQGVRIDNPSSGDFLIERRGGKSIKRIYR